MGRERPKKKWWDVIEGDIKNTGVNEKKMQKFN